MANLEKYKEAARKFELKEQWSKAIEVLVKAVEEFEKSPDNDADLALYNKTGDLYVKVNDPTNAIQYYERAVDMYQEAGLVNPAIAVCNKVMRLSPGRASIYLKLGMLFAKKGFAAEAKQNLIEYADRMQKAGQIEEAFRALKKFAEMTPGQEEIWTVLAQAARAQAKTPEAKEQVERLIGEFEAKDKAGAQRKSRMSRSMVTGEDIKEEPGPKKGELIFLDIDDVPTPGRKSGAMRASAPKTAGPPPRATPAATPPPRVTPKPAPPPEVIPEPEPEVPSLEIQSTSLADDAPAADLPLIELEPEVPADTVPMAGLERTSMGDASSLGLEPTSFEMPSLDLEPTAAPSDAAAEPPAMGLEPTGFDVPVDEPIIQLEPEPAAPAAEEIDLAGLDLTPPAPSAEPVSIEQEPLIEEPVARVSTPRTSAPRVTPTPAPRSSTPAAPPPRTTVPRVSAPADFPRAVPEPVAMAPEPEPALEEEVPTESEVAQSLEFLDLGAVEEPTAPSLKDLEKKVRANSEDWDSRRLYAEALIEHGERDKGLSELDATLTGFDGADDVPSATAVVEEMLRLEPNSVRHQQKRVELAYRSGDRSRLVDAYVELADALLRSNDPDKAIAVYQRVLEHDKDNVRARTAIETLAPPAAAKPEAPAAAPKQRQSFSAMPKPMAASSGDYVDLGAMLLDEDAPMDTRMRIEDEEPTGDEQKDFQQMLAAFKKGIDQNVGDEDFQSHYDLGVAYKEMGLVDEAIAEFQKSLRAPDGKLKSSEALGLCFYEKQQFQVAETILKRGLDGPSHGDAERVGLLYWLGRTQEEQGKEKDALESYNRVFAVDINFQDVNQRVQALSSSGAKW